MDFYKLTPFDLGLASLLVISLSVASFFLKLGMASQILIAAIRTTIQLSLIGLVLHWVFAQAHLGLISLIAFSMLLIAGYEVMSRQRFRFTGWWGYGIGSSAMFVSSFSVTLIALLVIFRDISPWYTPQYAIPLLGMLLGNTMNGIAIGLDRLNTAVWNERAVIENRLMLGESWDQAIRQIRQDSVRSGMIPIINAMAAAGIVSLPGMMTGQILAGAAPIEAVKYQILIMFLIAAGTGFGTYLAIWLASRHFFDARQRLRLERLKAKE